MIIIKFGRWDDAYHQWLRYDRLYYKGHRIPFCRVQWRDWDKVYASRRYRFCQWLKRYWLYLWALFPWLIVLAQCLSQACPGGACPLP